MTDDLEEHRRRKRWPDGNPGSREAIARGCACPSIDNHYGKGMPYPSGPRWWIAQTCPLHGGEG